LVSLDGWVPVVFYWLFVICCWLFF
jgi:hypothetical protein